MPAPDGFVYLTATRIQNAVGGLLAQGTLEVLPTDGNNVPIPATAGGVGGLIVDTAGVLTITNGVLQAGAYIVDTTRTKPLDISYRLTVKDAQGRSITVLKYVQAAAGTTLNLDTYQPRLTAAQAIGVVGPPGPALNFRGVWSSGTTYALGDAVAYGPTNYVSLTAGNLNHQPDTSSGNWVQLALTGAKGDMGDNGSPGSAGPPANFAGVWASGTAYTAGQAVSYTPNGNSYVALASTTGDEPDISPTKWGLLASAATSSTAVRPLVSAILPTPVNVFDKTKVVLNFYYNLSGVVTGYSGYNHSGIMYAPGATQMVANFSIRSDGYTRVAYLDATGAVMSMGPIAGNGSDFPAGTTITLPGTQTYVIVTMLDLSALATDMVVVGTSGTALPGTYTSFGPNVSSVEAANIAAAVSAASATLNASIVAGAHTSPLAAQAATPVPVNILDVNKLPTLGLIVNGSGASAGLLTSLAGYQSTGFIPVFGLTNIATNFAFGGYSDYGIAFYDASQNFIAGSGITPNNGNMPSPNIATTYPVPTGAVYMRGYFTNFNANGIPGAMVISGTVAPPATTAGYVPFFGNANPFFPSAAALPLLGWLGKNLAWIGDSISTYRDGPTPKVLSMLGLNQSYKTAKIGRFMWQAFEAPGAGWPTPTAFTDGTVTNVAPTAASFAAADAIVLFLGTNIADRANLGTLDANGEYSITNDPPLAVFPLPGSTPTASFASQMAGVITQLLEWNPYAKIVWVTPYQSSDPGPADGTGLVTQAGLAAIRPVNVIGKAVARYFSVPVVDLFNDSGITPLTIPLYLGLPSGGSTAWSSVTTYSRGQWVGYGSFGVTFISLVDNNLNHPPSGVQGVGSETPFWQASGDGLHPQQVGLDRAIAPAIARKLVDASIN